MKISMFVLKTALPTWIVVDKNIPYQQNLSNLPCLIVVLGVYRNTLKHLCPLIPKIFEVLQTKKNASKVVVIKP